jgi:hypothetical protein
VNVGAPRAAVLSVAALWTLLVGQPDSYGRMLVNLAILSLFTLLAAALATPQIRGLISHFTRRGVQSKAVS